MTIVDGLVRTWRVADLHPHPLNPRETIADDLVAELAESIQEHGILQPLVVTPDGMVLIGHRRLVAAQLVGLSVVPVIVRDAPTLADQLTIMLTENLQRQDLTPVEEARAFQRLVEAGLSRADIARRCGLNTNQVQSRLAILKLDSQVQEMIGRRELPMTIVPVLAKVGDPIHQRRLAVMAATRRSTVEQIEKLVARGTKAAVTPKSATRSAVIPPSGPGRGEVVALLRATPKRALTFADLLAVFDGACSVCYTCGMADLETACRECPGPLFIKLLVKRLGNDR